MQSKNNSYSSVWQHTICWSHKWWWVAGSCLWCCLQCVSIMLLPYGVTSALYTPSLIMTKLFTAPCRLAMSSAVWGCVATPSLFLIATGLQTQKLFPLIFPLQKFWVNGLFPLQECQSGWFASLWAFWKTHHPGTNSAIQKWIAADGRNSSFHLEVFGDNPLHLFGSFFTETMVIFLPRHANWKESQKLSYYGINIASLLLHKRPKPVSCLSTQHNIMARMLVRAALAVAVCSLWVHHAAATYGVDISSVRFDSSPHPLPVLWNLMIYFFFLFFLFSCRLAMSSAAWSRMATPLPFLVATGGIDLSEVFIWWFPLQEFWVHGSQLRVQCQQRAGCWYPLRWYVFSLSLLSWIKPSIFSNHDWHWRRLRCVHVPLLPLWKPRWTNGHSHQRIVWIELRNHLDRRWSVSGCDSLGKATLCFWKFTIDIFWVDSGARIWRAIKLSSRAWFRKERRKEKLLAFTRAITTGNRLSASSSDYSHECNCVIGNIHEEFF